MLLFGLGIYALSTNEKEQSGRRSGRVTASPTVLGSIY